MNDFSLSTTDPTIAPANAAIAKLDRALVEDADFDAILAAMALNGQLGSLPEHLITSLAQPDRYGRAVEAVRVHETVGSVIDAARLAWFRYYSSLAHSSTRPCSIEILPQRLPAADETVAAFLKRLAIAKVVAAKRARQRQRRCTQSPTREPIAQRS